MLTLYMILSDSMTFYVKFDSSFLTWQQCQFATVQKNEDTFDFESYKV